MNLIELIHLIQAESSSIFTCHSLLSLLLPRAASIDYPTKPNLDGLRFTSFFRSESSSCYFIHPFHSKLGISIDYTCLNSSMQWLFLICISFFFCGCGKIFAKYVLWKKSLSPSLRDMKVLRFKVFSYSNKSFNSDAQALISYCSC